MRSIAFILLGLLGLVDSASARPDNTTEYSPQARQKIVEWQDLIDYLRPQAERNDLMPVYAFNSQNLWMLDRKFGEHWAATASRLDAWKAFRDRDSELFSDFPANNSAFVADKTLKPPY